MKTKNCSIILLTLLSSMLFACSKDKPSEGGHSTPQATAQVTNTKFLAVSDKLVFELNDRAQMKALIEGAAIKDVKAETFNSELAVVAMDGLAYAVNESGENISNVSSEIIIKQKSADILIAGSEPFNFCGFGIISNFSSKEKLLEKIKHAEKIDLEVAEFNEKIKNGAKSILTTFDMEMFDSDGASLEVSGSVGLVCASMVFVDQIKNEKLRNLNKNSIQVEYIRKTLEPILLMK